MGKRIGSHWEPKDENTRVIGYTKIVTHTPKALLVRIDDHEFWLPRSGIVEIDENTKSMEVLEWLARDRGLG